MCTRCLNSHSNGSRTEPIARAQVFREIYKARAETERIWHLLFKGEEDDFLKIANELADLLISTWDQKSREAINEFIRAARGGGDFTPEDLNAMLNQLRVQLGATFANDVAQPLLEVNTESYKKGIGRIIELSPSFSVDDVDAKRWLDNHQIFWVRNYFDRQLASEVSKVGQQAITDGLSRSDAAELFQQQFQDKFDVASFRYWDGFANHVTTRAREFGRVDGYERGGVESLRVVAVIDHRTSGICRYMNNRIIPVGDAVELRDEMMKAQNPEDVIDIAPFLTFDDVRGNSTSQLKEVSLGYATPPYHFDCRSRTVVHKTADPVPLNEPTAGTQDEKDLLNMYSQQEYDNHFAQIGRKQRFQLSDAVSDRQRERLSQLNLSDTDEMSNFVRDHVRNADRKFVQAFENKNKSIEDSFDVQFNFFTDTHRVVIGTDYQVQLIQSNRSGKFSGVDDMFETYKKNTKWHDPNSQ